MLCLCFLMFEIRNSSSSISAVFYVHFCFLLNIESNVCQHIIAIGVFSRVYRWNKIKIPFFCIFFDFKLTIKNQHKTAQHLKKVKKCSIKNEFLFYSFDKLG